MNPRSLTLLAGLALALSGLLSGNALSAAGGSDLPFKASPSGYSTLNLLTGEVHIVGSGTGTHGGLTTAEEYGQAIPTGAATFSYSGSWTGTAANGDQLFATSTGTFTYTDATHSTGLLSYTFTGGTGRFANVTGVWTATVHSTRISLDGAIATDSWDATITGRLSL